MSGVREHLYQWSSVRAPSPETSVPLPPQEHLGTNPDAGASWRSTNAVTIPRETH